MTAENLGGVSENVTLTDELRFGAGITVNTATPVAVAAGTPAPSAAWNGETNTTLYTGPIAAGATYSYRMVVNAEVAAGVIDTPAGLCPADPADDGGFNNEANLNSPADPAVALTASACDEPTRPAMQKAITVFSQNPDGTWNVTYRVTVTNDSPNQQSYDLTDELHFGPDSTVLGATVTGSPAGVTLATPAWDGQANTLVADDVILPAATAGGPTVHEYTLTVLVDIAPAADLTSPAWQCPTGVSNADQALNNFATANSGNEVIEDNACAEPSSPSLTKAVQQPATQQPDGTWTFSYVLTVTNSDTDPVTGLSYNLDDTFEFPADVDVNTVTVAGPAGITTNPDFNGGLTEVGGGAVTADTGVLQPTPQVIPAATAAGPTVHQFVITVNASVPAGMDAAELSCSSGPATDDGGFSNTAQLTGSGVDTEAEDCTDVPNMPATTVEKTVQSSTQNDDGTWIIVYDLDVTNDDINASAIYDLTDTLEYGSDITINSSSVTTSPAGVTLATPAWDGITETLISQGAVLPAGATHHYEVTVNSTPSADTYGSDSGTCEEDGGTDGGGFVNTAETTSGGVTNEDEACETIPAPDLELEKDVEGDPEIVNVGDTVHYVVRATNTGDAHYTDVNPADIVDDLTDVLDNATYNDDAAASLLGTLEYTEPRITWTGILHIGETIEITYTVTVTTYGDRELENIVTAPIACPPCEASTLTTLATPPLAFTGSTTSPPLLYATTAALLAGIAILIHHARNQLLPVIRRRPTRLRLTRLRPTRLRHTRTK